MFGLCIGLFRGLGSEAAPLILPEPAPGETAMPREVTRA
jgi:hypothetical protein